MSQSPKSHFLLIVFIDDSFEVNSDLVFSKWYLTEGNKIVANLYKKWIPDTAAKIINLQNSIIILIKQWLRIKIAWNKQIVTILNQLLDFIFLFFQKVFRKK